MVQEPLQTQNEILNAARKERKRVAILLVNGIRLVGHVESFDQYLLMLSSATGTQAIYKRAISTIQPDTGKPPSSSGPRPSGGGSPRDRDRDGESKRTVVISHKRRPPTIVSDE
jgi:host factor-I protein